MNYKIKGYCHKARKDADNKSILYISISCTGYRESLVSTGKKIDADSFDNRMGCFVKKKFSARQRALEQNIQEIDHIIYEFRKEGICPIPEQIRETFKNRHNKDDFCEFARKEALKEKGARAEPTIRDYIHCIDKLSRYKSKLSFSEITPQFLEGYYSYLKHVKNRKDKGIYHDMATIRKFWNVAKKRGLVRTNPFEFFKLKTSKSNGSNYLVQEELMRLFDLFKQKTLCVRHQNILYYYLMACFTSLRSKDVYELSIQLMDSSYKAKIIHSGKLEVFLSKSRYKKKTVVDITAPLLYLLEYAIDRPLVQSVGRRNKALREVLAIAGIEKYLTFHSARHTFGVVSKQLGIDNSTLKEIYQHSSFEMTDHYARIADDLKKKEMSKWNSF